VPEHLERLGIPVLVVPTLGEALTKLEAQTPDVCVLDLTADRILPAPVRLLRTRHPRLPVVGLVDPMDAILAGDAVQAGIYDVLPWPCEERDLALVIANAADRSPCDAAASTSGPQGHEPLFAQSAAMRDVLEQARSIASTRGAVMICGEAGSGRRLMARTVHRWSTDGEEQPFVAFDCAIEDGLDVEHRLFGAAQDRRSSRTTPVPAVRVSRSGAVMAARGGTLFLERIVDLPARVQGALARLLRDREAVLEGGHEMIDLELRAVASFGTDVERSVEDGRLQAELFDRLSQWRIDMPPIRRRKEDVPAIAAWLVGRICRETKVSPKLFSRSALALLSALPWHGNVEDLRGVLERLVKSVSRSVIQIDDLLEHTSLDGISTRLEVGVSLRDAKARFERECISAVLRRHHGRVGEAAKALGIQRTNLYRKVRQLNVSRSLLSARR